MVSTEFLRELFIEIAKDENLKPSDVEDIYNSIFKYTKRALMLPSLPDVQLTGLGKFSISAPKLRKTIGDVINSYRSGRVTPEGLAKFMNSHWPAYKIAQRRVVRKQKRKK